MLAFDSHGCEIFHFFYLFAEVQKNNQLATAENGWQRG